ncbi:MAG: hypothetical protein K940chlam2_00644, partial [Chlamydiae bacterium]|nr:hypothetical protein [Chlamydiota bacterium]
MTPVSSGSPFNLMEMDFVDLNVVLNAIHGLDANSLETARRAFFHLFQHIPTIDHEAMRALNKRLGMLLNFPELRQEQAQLATDLGRWHASSSPKEAMHYDSIALNIEETEERHRLASTLFMKWIIQDEGYKKQLEHAYGMGDPERFDT